MSDSENIIVNIPSLEARFTFNTPTVTVGPAEINEAVEKSELSLAQQTIIITIISELTKQGIVELKDVVTSALNALKDNPELFNSFVEIVKSITQSN